MQHPWRAVIIGWLALLTIGIVGLVWLYRDVLPGLVSRSPSASLSAPSTKTPSTGKAPALSNATAPTTNEDLATQVSELSARVNAIELQATAAGKTKTVVVNNNTTTTVTAPATGKISESFLPLGGGTTDNRDWTTMTGAQIMFDPKKFGQIVSVRFEAAGSIIGGEVHARLIDVTHNTIYYSTELMFNTNSPTWKRSTKFSIPTSPTTFQVQILSTSGETANLQDSRLVIESKN